MKRNTIIFITMLLLIVLSACQEPEADSQQPTLFPSDCCSAATDLGNGWVPVWCDEFSGTEIDANKWNIENNPWGGGNNEYQYYTPDNVFIEDGKLIIEARRELYMGKQFTSGRMNTKLKGDWLYGRIVVRAKMAHGIGTWGGIWMFSTSQEYGPWPSCGEIDIVEYVGHEPNKIHSTIHSEKYNWTKETNTSFRKIYPDVEETFYDYEIIWEPGSIQLFVSGDNIGNFSYSPWLNQEVLYQEAWPFDKAFHLILNLAVGGTWGAAGGIDSLAFPTRMEVEYVRVYQRDYQYIDREAPSQIGDIYRGNNIKRNMIFWNIPTDDYLIESYEIYVNDNLHGTSNVNSFVITDLTPDTNYQVSVVAVDFSGKKSEPKTIDFLYD